MLHSLASCHETLWQGIHGWTMPYKARCWSADSLSAMIRSEQTSCGGRLLVKGVLLDTG